MRVFPLKDKKGITITNAFLKILYESNLKSNKILVDKGSEFYNRSLKSWLHDNEVYSVHNKRKSVVAKRFIRTLKNKIYKYMTSISKYVYAGKLHYIVSKCNNTYHSTITMKPVDVKSTTYIKFNKENNKENSKFKVGDQVRISKYKNISTKGYTPNWSKEVFVIKKLKILCGGYTLLVTLTMKKLLESFQKSNCQKQIKKSLKELRHCNLRFIRVQSLFR